MKYIGYMKIRENRGIIMSNMAINKASIIGVAGCKSEKNNGYGEAEAERNYVKASYVRK